jgi:hypothetical protein
MGHVIPIRGERDFDAWKDWFGTHLGAFGDAVAMVFAGSEYAQNSRGEFQESATIIGETADGRIIEVTVKVTARPQFTLTGGEGG